MAYFSRLTDIVTCNLSEILAASDDADAALRQIIAEMEEGLKGAQRSVATAKKSQDKTRTDLGEQQRQVQHWADAARSALAANDEDKARLSLIRKQEAEDVAAGLEQQLNAATSTLEHLSTLHRALEGRLADARRRLAGEAELESPPAEKRPASTNVDADRSSKVEAELEALRRELKGS